MPSSYLIWPLVREITTYYSKGITTKLIYYPIHWLPTFSERRCDVMRSLGSWQRQNTSLVTDLRYYYYYYIIIIGNYGSQTLPVVFILPDFVCQLLLPLLNRHAGPRLNSLLEARLYLIFLLFRRFALCNVLQDDPISQLYAAFKYSRTSVTRTLMARLPRLFQTRS